jgi:Ca2+:H+ antiporter
VIGKVGLVFVPLALVLEFTQGPGLWLFVVSALALLPLAGWMGRATEELALRAGSTVGGLLNATFGNAAELIIAGIALANGQLGVVKASITGSILSNLLLVFGLAIFLGGLRRGRQFFNRDSAALQATMLTLTMLALLLPAFFEFTETSYYHVDPKLPSHAFSVAAACVLVVVYGANLVFALLTHRQMLGEADEHDHEPTWSTGLAVGILVAATAGVAMMAEFLVGSLDVATKAMGLSEFFVGIILIPLVGNAAEHMAAVHFAMRDKMDLAVQIAIGSSLQVALLVAPLLVFMGLVLGQPMDLVFHNPLELAGLAASIIAVNAVARDGETHWMEGAMLLAVYLLLGCAFFFVRTTG